MTPRTRKEAWQVVGAVAIMVAVFLLFVLLLTTRARAHDDGQWENSDPAIVEWFRSLKMPDAPLTSCCGEADAYWTTEPYVRDGKTYVKIDDPRADAPLHRPHMENGTEILIPVHKLKWDRGNPTGHPIVFLSYQGWVYCFVQAGGA